MTDKILKFSAPWCQPCKQLAKTLENYKGVPIEDVNIDDAADLAAEYMVRSVPTLVYERDGKEVSRKMGAISKDAFSLWVQQQQAS